MRPNRPPWGALAAVAGAVVLLITAVLAAAASLVGTMLDPAAAEAAAAATWARLPLVVGLVLAGGAVAAMAAAPWLRRAVAAPARLLEQTRVLLATDVRRELKADGGTPALKALAGAINDLAAQRDHLREEMAAQVAEASRGTRQERNRLAALMSELTQSVVV
ncbi:MAG: DNA polymerase III subunit epsilon, partial [Ideonella sp.]|nr:DNA polymerase III subunit epsilon [Ideonella sp.]